MSTTIQAGPQVGELAPEFTLPSTSGEKVSLASFRGQRFVLLAFFPLAFTPVCTGELCAFDTEMAKFAAVDAKVFGIAVDHTASQKAFQERDGFTTELLSDFKREVAREYGVLIEDLGFSKRAYFLVDKQGRLAWKWVETELGQRRTNAELLDQIQKLT